MTLAQSQPIVEAYDNLHKKHRIPLLSSVLAAAELACEDWPELLEAHIATLWQAEKAQPKKPQRVPSCAAKATDEPMGEAPSRIVPCAPASVTTAALVGPI